MSRTGADGIIAVIPARGGSKRIPNKNIVDFYGRPMIEWTVRAAKCVDGIARIVVSTDSKDIAHVAESVGVEVPFLRDRYVDDHTPVSLATLRAVEQAEEHYHETYSTILQLMPNCPLRSGKDIQGVIDTYFSEECSAAISIFRPPFVNVYWAMTQDPETHRLESLFPKQRDQRSQDMESVFLPTGAVWVGDKQYIRRERSYYGTKTIGVEIGWQSAIDIDEADELEFARLLAPEVLGDSS